MNSSRYNSRVMNFNSKTNNTTFKFDKYKIIYLGVSILLILCLLYIIICYYNYQSIECYKKKSFFEYLFDMNNNEICTIYQKPMPLSPSLISKKSVTPISNVFNNKEVFHIANQEYTYDQSKCKCASYNGRLATKDEVTKSYNNGANWCSYGWTEGQNAFYPVQKCFYDELNQDEEFLENSDKYCGKPGLNGGYFSNPKLKFGVNCYGVKPKGEVIKAKKPHCQSKNFCSLKKNNSASQKLTSDIISPFNDNKWNN